MPARGEVGRHGDAHARIVRRVRFGQFRGRLGSELAALSHADAPPALGDEQPAVGQLASADG